MCLDMSFMVPQGVRAFDVGLLGTEKADLDSGHGVVEEGVGGGRGVRESLTCPPLGPLR